ncbi:hypothetical protein Pla108_27230 [Botrimarina colliarenosi]|uniref:Competence protein A n=1 Tax=Botrimarina colliarenosi TaxID=2528001 RepID=A0A5C6AC11_9BACT|nr:hypothetical protein [Botrimarina colliarenosi]TWT96946.1 hypothetical protein Pla108_27230 [Botrimarina colliarenosi]
MLTLALQTDSRGVTGVLVDRAKSGATQFVGVATVERAATAAKLAAALQAALPKLNGGKPLVAVALGPDEVRVKRLAVPPAPAEELPPIVAMQAAREAAVDADAIVADFVPPAAEGAPAALTAWATQETLTFWQAVAEELGGKLTVVAPRALAGAQLIRDGASTLLVTRAGDSLDLIARHGGEPVLVRSARVGDGPADRELRRTLLSLSGEGVESPRVVASHADLGASELIDWQNVLATLGADTPHAATLGDAAAATGLALGGASLINLADPRRPPVAKTDRRRQILLGVTAATVLLAGVWMAYDRMARLDRQITDKEREIAAAEAEVEAFEPYRDRVAALDAWRQSDVNWLDELDRLSQKLRPEPLDAKDFPVANDIRATQLIATAFLGGDEPGGRVDLTAVARSSSTSELEARLRSDDHPVEPISTAESPAKDAYRYKYSALLRVPPDLLEDDGPTTDDSVADDAVADDAKEEKPTAEEPVAEEPVAVEPAANGATADNAEPNAVETDTAPTVETTSEDAGSKDAENEDATPDDAAEASEVKEASAEEVTP